MGLTRAGGPPKARCLFVPHPPSEKASASGRLAIATRYHGPNAPQTLAARRDLAVAHVAASIEKHLADAPPLTDEQLARLHALLDGHR